MSKNITKALVILKQERTHLETLRAKLDEAIASLEALPGSDLGATKLPVLEAIDLVLQSSARPMTVAGIMRAGLEHGWSLNANSVRWELRRAVEAGRYEKLPPESGRSKLYRPLSVARATEPVDRGMDGL